MARKIEQVDPSLEIEERLDLHRKGWIVQRIGWALMLLFIVAAALGAFGDGILSRERLTNNGISVHYEKLFRHETETEIRIQAPGRDGQVEVILSPAFARNYRIDRIIPQPAQRSIRNGSNVMVFAVEGAADISFIVEPSESGRRASPILINGTAFNLSTYIYP